MIWAMRIGSSAGVFLLAVVAGFVCGRYTIELPDFSDQRLLTSARQSLATRRYAEAISVVRQIMPDSPAGAEAKLIEGVALWKLNRWDAAEGAWKKAIALDPKVPEAAWHLLSFYFVQQRWREAEELVLQLYAVEPDPRDRTLLLLELVRQDTERLAPDDTARALEPVTLVEPQNYHARRVLGLSYVQLGRTREGLTLIEHAVHQKPAESDGWFNWVWCLYETGQTDQLARLWSEIPADVLDHADFQRYRGFWFESTGDWDEAERAYRRALAADPYDRKAHYQLARLLQGRGQNDDAIEHAEMTRRLDDAREELARCYALAAQQQDNPSAELCREFSRLCRVLGRTRQADYWEREHAGRRSEQTRSHGPPQFRPYARVDSQRSQAVGAIRHLFTLGKHETHR